MAYPRYCKHCEDSIIMSELTPGKWQPWEPNGSGRHQCNSSKFALPKTALPLPSLLVSVKTYLTRCHWCQEPIYCHTNGNGDSVYTENGLECRLWEPHRPFSLSVVLTLIRT